MELAEAELERLLSPHPAFRMFLACRRINRAVDCRIGKPRRELTWLGGRRVLELAVWKFGRLDDPGVRERPEIVNVWERDELEALADAYVVAMAHYNLAAWYRRLSKGQPLRVAGGPGILPWLRPTDAGDTDRLIQRWEERVADRDGGILGGLGQHEKRSDDRLPILVATHAPLDLDALTLPLLAGAIDAADVFAFPWLVSRETLEHLDALFGSLLVARGFTFWDIVAVMLACTDAAWLALERADTDPSDRRAAAAAASMFRRGYLLARKPAADLVAHAEAVRDSSRLLRDRATVSCSAAADALTLRASDIDLHARTPWAPIYRSGDVIAYDLLAAPGFLQRSVADLALPEARRQAATRAFEASVHAGLGRFGAQPLSSGKELRLSGKVLSDIDASCVTNGVLVIVDTYSAPRTTAIDRGDHSNTRNRWERLIEKLKKWRELGR